MRITINTPDELIKAIESGNFAPDTVVLMIEKTLNIFAVAENNHMKQAENVRNFIARHGTKGIDSERPLFLECTPDVNP